MKNKMPMALGAAVVLVLLVGVLYYFSTGLNKGAIVIPDGKGRAALLSSARVLSPNRAVKSTDTDLKLSSDTTSPTPVANQNKPIPLPKK